MPSNDKLRWVRDGDDLRYKIGPIDLAIVTQHEDQWVYHTVHGIDLLTDPWEVVERFREAMPAKSRRGAIRAVQAWWRKMR